MGNALTYDQMKVVCRYPIQRITELQFVSSFNEHSKVRIQGILRDDEKAKCIEAANSQDLIQVYEQSKIGDVLLFSGFVASLQVRHVQGIYYVEIEGLSHTHLLDAEVKSRSFQDQSLYYSGLIEQVLADYPKYDFIQMPEDRATGGFILQYQETDWAFLKRIASHFQTVLIPDVLGEGPRFWLGIHQQSKQFPTVINYTMRNGAEQYRRACSYGLEVIESDFVKYEVQSYDRLMLGDRVSFQGRDCVVESVSASFVDGILTYQYTLGGERGIMQPLIRNERIHGISLLGEVLDAQNQEVKIKLRIDEKQDSSKACWFPYAAQANNMFYCMPERGTSISLYFPSSDEGSCMAVNMVRRNGGNCSKTSNPNNKYMGIPSGQEFKLGETDIDFVADDELFITMDNDSGIQVQSSEDLNVFAKQRLIMEAQEKFKVSSRSGSLVVSTGVEADKAQLNLAGGIDGNANIYSEVQILCDGRYRQVFGEKLNAEIVYEEKSFDLWKSIGCALLAVAAVAVVVLVVVATGGAALAAVGICATKFAVATIGTAAVFAAAKVADDWYNGETSDFLDYLLAAAEGALAGVMIVCPFLGQAALYHQLMTDPVGLVNGMIENGLGLIQDVGCLLRGERFNPSRLIKTVGTAVVAYGTKQIKEPIDVATGVMVVEAVDFELPGLIPLIWSRTWYSDSRLVGQLGHSMRHSFEMGLDVYEEERTLVVYLGDGRQALFPYLLVGEEFFSYEEKMLLRREADCYTLFDPESRQTSRFELIAGGFISYQLTDIFNEQGHRIQFSYDTRGYLSEIMDSVGRRLSVISNDTGQITEVLFGQISLVQYRYNQELDLTEAADALGQTTEMFYRNHLMQQKTDKNAHTFYWKYEYTAPGARVTETFGEDGTLQGKFVYHDEENYTEVIDCLGSTEYHYDERRAVTKIIYPDFTQIREVYNERCELESTVDEEGRLTRYEYNDWSQVTKVIRPDGSKVKYVYDEKGRTVAAVNPEEASRRWLYNEDGTVQQSLDELNVPTRYTYTENKLVETVKNIKGDTIHLNYDSDYNLAKVTLPDGSSSSWEYDRRGNCISARNPLGAVQEYQYDELNRLVQARLADGNEVQLEYNAYEDVIRAKDKQTEVLFDYTILGSLKARKQGGKKVQFKYDTEERLIAITNEQGEVYQFEHDVKGNIVKEVGFDKVTRTYERDQSGLIKKINRPGGRFTAYQHDKLGNMVRVDYFDKTWDQFAYNKNGELLEATNGAVAVRFERNKAGQITKEWQDDYFVSSSFDELGNRTNITSSLGAKIAAAHDQMGQVSHMAAAQNGQSAWTSQMAYNELGQEMERMLPGNVISKQQYDITGRPIHHQVRSQNRDTRRRKYSWDINHRLTSNKNELTGTQTTYSYDESSNLIWSQDANFDFLHRSVDDVGNLYETEDKSDRIYGEGSRLLKSNVDTKELRNEFQGGYGKLVTRGIEFSYDEEGNLIRKAEPNGDVWRYEYFGNGMMSKVIRPDQVEIAFKYDSMGRRIEKRSDSNIIKFVWDGNTLLHEWEAAEETASNASESLVTWVFHDSFVPTAKITNKGNYSIISDYLGTPVEVYDSEGNQVWTAELDIYGRVKEIKGEEDFIPFRYQGQYVDAETGLYYNRFRYYSPVEGCYTQPDPIGLDSGVYNFYRYVSNPNNTIDPFGLDWNYLLRDILGNAYYHGRASDNASMMDVARRHAGTIGADGARFGLGDTLEVVTPKGTPYDTVRGVEQRGIQQNELLGRGNQNVRGNKINGISDAKQQTNTGQRRLSNADKQLNGNKPDDKLSHEDYKKGCRG